MSDRLRVAIVGCGAIADAHARALAHSTEARCTAVFDVDRARAVALARTWCPDAVVLGSIDEAPRHADAAIVATPNAYHAATTLTLLRAGLHVLCEKPLAIAAADAESMLAAARAANRVLACGFVRRQYPATELVRQLLARRVVGAPVSFEIRESVTNWPMQRSAFRRDISGGGVFIDIAPHVLDQLRAWFGRVEVEEYADDAAGGVEASARATVRCTTPDGSLIGGVIHVSRAYAMKNRATIRCSDGRIDVDPHQRDRVTLTLGLDGVETTMAAPAVDGFAAQLHRFVAAIAAGDTAERERAAQAAVDNVAAIARAYAMRKALPEPWNGGVNDASNPIARDGVRRWQRILVTGATGSVGSRLVERWAMADQLPQLRCLVRGYRAAARLCRFEAEIAPGDLGDRAALVEAARGCDAVVHLAVGDEAAAETELLVRVCKELGVRRFVHMSSAAVYGRRLPRAIEAKQESTPLARTGEPYADAKAAAERIVLQAGAALDAHILRPHMVYGPGLRWSAELTQLLPLGRVPIIDGGGVINMIHVDDLVDAVACALAADGGFGEPMFVTDDQPRAWSEYIAAHAALVGVTPPHVARDEVADRRDLRTWLRDSVAPLGPVVRSREFKSFVLQSPLMQATALRAYVAVRGNERLQPYLARLRQDGSGAATADAPSSWDETWLQMQLSEAHLSSTLATSMIGFRARIDFAEGLARTARWLEAFGLVPARG